MRTMKALGTRGSLDTCRCGTKAKKVPRDGKLRYRHKCPHGRWCAHGDRLLGRHANHNTLCRECRTEALERRNAADEGYQRHLNKEE